MTTVSIGSQLFSSIAEALKAAQPDALILLGPGLFDPSPASLAGAKSAGVTLKGNGSIQGSILRNTRIFSRGTDGGNPAARLTIEGIEFTYESNQPGYILAPSTGSIPYKPSSPTSTDISLINLAFTGQHTGANGANGTYVDLSGSKDSQLNHINVKLKGQKGYDPNNGSGGGFFLFFEGGDNLKVLNSSFDESGYSSSINILFTNNAQVINNQFKGGGLIKQDDGNDPADSPRGERFYNAGGTFSSNKLSDGAFFDFLFINSDPGKVWDDYKSKYSTLDGTYGIRANIINNTFDIIDSGYGILIRSDAPSGPIQQILNVSGNIFNGSKVICSRINTSHDLIFGQNTINGVLFDQLRVGGDGDDEINADSSIGVKRWISGGGGNDQLHGTHGIFDAFIFWASLDAVNNVDTIIGFDTSGAEKDQLWLDQSIFSGLLSSNGILSESSFTTDTNGISGAETTQIIYNPTSGELAFDPDGKGLAASTVFARMQQKETLSNQNFRIITSSSQSRPSLAQVSVRGESEQIGEEDKSIITYIFQRTGPLDAALSVQFMLSGTADEADYIGSKPGKPQTIDFGVNESTAILTLDPISDNVTEPEESIILTLLAGADYSIATPDPVVTRIRRDESQEPPPPTGEPLTLLAITPGNDSTAVALNSTISLEFSRAIKAGSGHLVLISDDRVFRLDPADSSLCTISGSRAVFSVGSILKAGMRYRIRIEGTLFTDLTGSAWNPVGRDHFDFSTAAALIKTSDNPSRLDSEVGSLELEDEHQNEINDFTGDFSKRNLDQFGSLSSEATHLLNRYRQHGNGGSQRASEAGTELLEIILNLGQAGTSTVATIKLATEVKATASLRIKSSGEVEDNTYDPGTDQGVELVDSDGNGLVDTLRIHLRDGSAADDDGVSDGRVRTTALLAEAPRRTVYRFYNQRSGVHFYTPDAGERDNVIRNSYGEGASFDKLQANPRSSDPLTGGWGYKYEGTAYEALDTQGTALYRFYNAEKRYHFLSTNAEEANTVIRNSVGAGYDLSNGLNKDPIAGGWGYKYEGSTYKVSTIAQHGMDQAVFRFYNASKGVHFYTASAEERNNVIRQSIGTGYVGHLDQAGKAPLLAGGWGYRFEGTAWYV